MADLLERLKTALADRYEIESELGRGGMATVYLAEDLKHGRKVAIKVIHPELAALVGTERFLREIRLSAKLEHPNILTLIDSGEADGLPYYVMPFIEGESLRGRLGHEGRVPVQEAARIAAELADALDYAHRFGVVHRDIKPANVLLSGGHALLTDFGVAYAIDEAGAEGLTATGLAVGSPVYMSPEQGAAEETDPRSDIYSLGCVLYELVAGGPPFSGETTRELLASHSLEAAPRLDRGRADVPEPLADAVERCLAKKPEKRFQTAAELRDALWVPSMAGLPGLTRNLTVLTGVSVAALAAVLFAVFREGLPYWLLGAAGTLLALQAALSAGALRQRRAVLGAGAAPGAWSRLRTRMGGALLGGAGLAALGVGSVATASLAELGIGPLSTLVSRGEIEFQPMVVVADFESPPDHPALGRSIARHMRAEIAETQSVDVVDEESMRRVLRNMQRAPGDPVNRDVATELAFRAGAEALLLGEVLKIGSGYSLVARLLSMPTEEELLAIREQAASADDVIRASNQLWRRLLREMGEPVRSIRRRPGLISASTSSLEALLKAEEAAYLVDVEDDRSGAIRSLEEAVELDPEFAQGWAMLAEFLHFDHQYRREAEALREACGLLDRIERQERASIEFRCLASEGRREEALQLAEAARERYGSVTGAAVYHTEYLMRWAYWEEAAASAARILDWYIRKRDSLEAIGEWDRGAMPGQVFLNNLANSLLALHRFAEADSVVASWPYWTPEDAPVLQWWRRSIAFAARDYDRAEASMDSVRARRGQAFTGWGNYARLAMAEGRLLDFEKWADFMADSAGRLVDAAGLALDLAWYRPDADTLDDRLAHTVAGESLEEWNERDLLTLARQWVTAGRADRARDVLDLYESRFPETERNQTFLYTTARADVEMAGGRHLPAVELYRQAFPERPDAENHGWDTYFRIGRAFEAAGLPDSAIAAYERAVAYPGGYSYAYEYYTLALSTERLAALYDARGDAAAALENYRLLAELWDEADPELQPHVEVARRRIAELSGDRSR
jgi:tetratricopeptide (TPR) repeat protein/tRNA A-37 threonylcarbamoyl transferase component Bud32